MRPSIEELKKRKTQMEGVEVEEYLKHGRSAMGLGNISGQPQQSTLPTPCRLDNAMANNNFSEVSPDDTEGI